MKLAYKFAPCLKGLRVMSYDWASENCISSQEKSFNYNDTPLRDVIWGKLKLSLTELTGSFLAENDTCAEDTVDLVVVVSYKRLLYSFKQLQSPTGSSKNNGQVIILLSIHVSDIFACSAVADINPNEKNTKTQARRSWGSVEFTRVSETL